MPAFTPFNCFTPTSSSSSQTLLPTWHPQDAATASTSTLSHQHRNNGYEDLTVHLTQSQNELRGRGGGDERRQGIRDFLRGRGRERARQGNMEREGEDMRNWGREVVKDAERRVESLTQAGEQMVQIRSVPKHFDDEDDISELELDGGIAVGAQQVAENDRVVVKRLAVAVGVEQRTNTLEEVWRWRGRRERDHCTPEERKMIEEWIASCERARCKGFVKRMRGGTEADEKVEESAQAEGEVNVRGGVEEGSCGLNRVSDGELPYS